MFQVRTFEARTLSWWFDERDNIDMNPPFQRSGGVWSPKDRGYLIDSILNGYDIPKFYIADFSYFKSSLNVTNKIYAVIDGKQRFGAIFEFFSGKLSLNEDFQYVADSTVKLAGLGYADLRKNYPEIARKFDNFPISVMSVITDEEGRINELFIRLNRSKPLIGAELRGAMKGKIPPLIAKLAEHQFFSTKVKFNKERKQHHDQAAKMLLLEFRGKFVDIKKTHLDRFVEEGSAAMSNLETFDIAASKTEEVLNVMTGIFKDKDQLLGKIGVLPVYYWFVKFHSYIYANVIREFLLKFEEERLRNSQLAKKSEPTRENRNIDEELLQYDVLNLKPNDQASLSGRYAILESRFKRFLSEQKIDTQTSLPI